MDIGQMTTTDITKYFKSLCTPSRIYLTLSLILVGLSLLSHFGIMELLIGLFWSIIWSFIINYICTIGMTNVAWAVAGVIGVGQIIAIISLFCLLFKHLMKKI
jgi:hypothetical protein